MIHDVFIAVETVKAPRPVRILVLFDDFAIRTVTITSCKRQKKNGHMLAYPDSQPSFRQ